MDRYSKSLLGATQTFGKIEMIISLIVSGIFLILTICGLIYVNFYFEKNYKSASAKIVNDPKCQTTTNSKGQQTVTGSMNVQFDSGSKTYIMNVNAGPNCQTYQKDSTVVVKFDPNNINQTLILSASDPKNMFNIILFIVLVFSVISIIYNYMLRNNKVAQTMSGVSGILGSVKSSVR